MESEDLLRCECDGGKVGFDEGGVDGARYSNVHRINSIGGSGVFSLVCTADDAISGQQVVLKFFHPAKLTDAYRLQCFEREIAVLTELNGQRDLIRMIGGREEFVETLVGTLGISIDIRFVFYALEKAQSDAADAISSAAWNWTQMLHHFRGMVRSVQRIRSLGFAHRDLKPDNFLLVNDYIRLSDFGTARNIAGVDRPILLNYSGPPGALLYTSPEMMACLHDVDARFAFLGDIFALGAILFELFTGIPLSLTMFGPALLTAMTSPMYAVPRKQRVTYFDGEIQKLANSNPIPEVGLLNPAIPRSISHRIDKLVQQMSALNYKQRVTDFSSIFRSVDSCILILRKEQQYLEWQRQIQRRRMQRAAKRNGVNP